MTRTTSVRGVRYLSLPFTSGYQYAAELAMLALLDAGVPVTWTPIDWQQPGAIAPVPPTTPPRLRAIAHADIPYDVSVVHAIPELLPVWRSRLEGPVVCSTAWETTKLPAHWPDLLRVADGVIVPSQFNRVAFVEAGLERVDVVPHHPPPPLDDVEPWVIGSTDGDEPFVFLALGEWTRRKGHMHTVQAFLEAFRAEDPVALVVRTSREDRTGQVPAGGGPLAGSTAWTLSALLREHGRADGRTPAVHLLTELLSPTEMRQMYRRADAFVSLSRGEGFGLGSFEMAAAGKPVVVTGFGGHLDYLDPHDAFLVDHAVVAVDARPGSASYTPDQRWADPSVGHAAALMRALVDDRDDAMARGARLQARIRRSFSASTITDQLLDVLEGATRSEAPGAGAAVDLR